MNEKNILYLYKKTFMDVILLECKQICKNSFSFLLLQKSSNKIILNTIVI
jgi:hypothetical protein